MPSVKYVLVLDVLELGWLRIPGERVGRDGVGILQNLLVEIAVHFMGDDRGALQDPVPQAGPVINMVMAVDLEDRLVGHLFHCRDRRPRPRQVRARLDHGHEVVKVHERAVHGRRPRDTRYRVRTLAVQPVPSLT